MKNINNSTKETKKTIHKKKWKKPSLLVLNKGCTEGGTNAEIAEDITYTSTGVS